MTKQERFDDFWAKYRNRNKKGKAIAQEKYFIAEEKWLKRNPGKTSNQFDSHVLASLEALDRYENLLRKAGEFVAHPCMASTYLNQARFDDEFESDKSSSELKQEIEKRFTCQDCGTEENVAGGLCAKCGDKRYPNPYALELKAKFETHKAAVPKTPDMSWYEWHQKVVEKFGLAMPSGLQPRKRNIEPQSVTKEEYEAMMANVGT